MYGSDANHRQVIISLMIVADNESEVTWKEFLSFTKSALKTDWTEVCSVTDQEKGACAAIKCVFP